MDSSNITNTEPKWKQRVQRLMQLIKQSWTKLLEIQAMWPRSTAGFTLSLLLVIAVLVLTGCCPPDVIVRPNPPLPPPPPALLQKPPTLDLLKPHQIPAGLYPPAESSKPTVR